MASIDKEQELKKGILSASLDANNDTENTILDTDLNNLLIKVLEKLTPQQHRIFEMSRKDMKSHKEIADELGISVYTVQQHISESLKVIRTYLLKYSETYTDIIVLLLCLGI